MPKRTSTVTRKTSETDVKVALNIEGTGSYSIRTGQEFFNHLLSSFAKHGDFDLKISANGDNEHHVVEDVAICLGSAFKEALGDKKGIRRFGSSIIPMDDVLMLVSIDVSGRSYCALNLKFKSKKIEGLSTEMIPHFFETFASESRINLHVRLLGGKNDHHKAEGLFKAFGIALKEACSLTGRGVPSTKGML